MLRAGGEHQQRFDLRGQSAMVTIQDPVANLLAERRTPRLSSRGDFESCTAHGRCHVGEVRRFADAFDAL
jgi:hypothetical protein